MEGLIHGTYLIPDSSNFVNIRNNFKWQSRVERNDYICVTCRPAMQQIAHLLPLSSSLPNSFKFASDLFGHRPDVTPHTINILEIRVFQKYTFQ